MVLGMGAAGNFARAQIISQNEEIRLPLGSVLEILVQEGSPESQYAWVLSLDRTFLQAGRGRSFRTRFAQAGRYLLNAEVLSPGRSAIRAFFTIVIEEGERYTSVGTGAILSTEPQDIQGRIGIAEDRHLVTVRPTPGALDRITLDADTAVDEDGDGNPRNDRSADGTFLSSDHLPIFLWLTGTLPTSFSVSGIQEDGTAFSRDYTVTSGSAPAPEPTQEPPTGGIAFTEEKNGAVRFHMDLSGQGTTAPVLPLWEFGDGNQSMLLQPIHQYAASGSYTVRVRLKDLRNGIDIRDLWQVVTVTVPRTSPIPEKPEPPSEPVPKATPTEGSTSSFFPFLLKVLLGLLLAGILGAGMTFLIIKLRRGKSLAERIEEADKHMVIGRGGASGNSTTPQPMSLPIQEVGLPEALAVETSPQKTSALQPSPPAPPPSLGPVPSWLQETPAAKTPSAPTSVAMPAPKPAAIPPAPSLAPAKELAPLLMDAAMPDWLTSPSEKMGGAVTLAATAAATPTPTPIKQPATPLKAETLSQETSEVSAPPAPTKGELAPSASPPPVPSIRPQSVAQTNNTLPTPATPKPMIPARETMAQEDAGALPPWLQPQAPKPPASAPNPESPSPMQQPEPPVSAGTPQAVILIPEPPKKSSPLGQKPVAASVIPPVPDHPPSPTTGKSPVEAPMHTASAASENASAPAAPNVLGEKERERRRLKRQRYRQNKQRREAVAAGNSSATPVTSPAPAEPTANSSHAPDDAPVAFIRAESIEKKEPPHDKNEGGGAVAF